MFKINNIKITVNGKLKKKDTEGMIIKSSILKKMIEDNIILPYKDSLVIHNIHMFNIQHMGISSKICPITKAATVENLAIIFFNKLSPLISKAHCKLIKVSVSSGDLKGVYAKKKITSSY